MRRPASPVFFKEAAGKNDHDFKILFIMSCVKLHLKIEINDYMNLRGLKSLLTIIFTSRTDKYPHHLSKFPLFLGAISVQNAHHSTQITPLTENSASKYGVLQETYHQIDGTEIGCINA